MAKIEQVIQILGAGVVLLPIPECWPPNGAVASVSLCEIAHMKLYPLVCLLMLLGFTQCKKKSSSPAAAVTDYQPLTAGSSWSYITDGNSYVLTMTNRDTVALARTYKVVTNSNGENQYIAKSGTDHYRFAKFQGLFPNGVEELYLRADQAVNATWQILIPLPVSGVTVNVTSKYTIMAKGISRTVRGKTYTDVIQVKQEFTSPFGNHGGGDHYYAKGVGLISTNLAITIPGQSINTVTELTTHQIR